MPDCVHTDRFVRIEAVLVAIQALPGPATDENKLQIGAKSENLVYPGIG